MRRITARDLRFFIFGMLCMFIFVIAYEWKEFKRGFTAGSSSDYNAVESPDVEPKKEN